MSMLNVKFCIVLAFPFILSPILFLGESNDKKLKCVFVILMTIGYSLIQAFPIHVAFLLPIILLPPLGIMDTGSVVSNYMKETAVICLGLTTIAIAIQRSNIQNRLIYKILLLTGSSPTRILTGVLLASVILSMWLEGIFIVTIMIQISLTIINELEKGNRYKLTQLGDEMESKDVEFINPENKNDITQEVTKVTPLTKESLYMKKALFLAITNGISIGSKGTLYGNQITIIFMQILESQGTFEKSQLNFVSWSFYNLPILVLSLGAVWLIISTYFFGISCKQKSDFNQASSTECDLTRTHHIRNMLKGRYKDLGPLSFQEMGTLLMLGSLIILWITREPKFFPGWSTYFPDQKVGDAVPSILIAFLLLILPYKWPRGNQPYETFISWKYLESHFPWGVLLIFGGSFALSDAVIKSGLSLWIEGQMVHLENLPKEIILLILLGICSIATEFLSGKVCFLVLYPIVTSMSWRLELHPLYLGLPLSVACSYGFMLPSSTAYAALMFTLAEGDIKISEMIKSGIGQNIACVFILFFMNMYWGEYVFNYSDYSNYTNTSTTAITATGRS